MGDSSEAFEVGQQFAKIHEDLRQLIAHNWQEHFETYPLPAELEKSTSKKLKALKSKYPEFEDVNLENRE